MPHSFSSSISLAEEDDAEMKRQMAGRGLTNRSEFFRALLWEHAGGRNPDRKPGTATGAADPSITGTLIAAHVREKIAGMAGVQAPAGDDYPWMDVAGYGLALSVAQNRMDEIRAGTLPLVPGDALAAGLDPHGKKAWDLYEATLPLFFQALLGTERPAAVDARYDPLDSVDGQHAGAIRGEVASRGYVYPDGDTAKYVRLAVRTASQEVPVLVPAGLGGEGMAAGMTVYAAGVFRVARRKVEMRACKCVMERIEGYDAIYGLADDWGFPDAAATEAVLMLRKMYGADAPAAAPAFRRYAEMSRDSIGDGAMLEIPGSKSAWLNPEEVRAGPENEAGVRECIRLWPSAVRRHLVPNAHASGWQ